MNHGCTVPVHVQAADLTTFRAHDGTCLNTFYLDNTATEPEYVQVPFPPRPSPNTHESVPSAHEQHAHLLTQAVAENRTKSTTYLQDYAAGGATVASQQSSGSIVATVVLTNQPSSAFEVPLPSSEVAIDPADLATQLTGATTMVPIAKFAVPSLAVGTQVTLSMEASSDCVWNINGGPVGLYMGYVDGNQNPSNLVTNLCDCIISGGPIVTGARGVPLNHSLSGTTQYSFGCLFILLSAPALPVVPVPPQEGVLNINCMAEFTPPV